MQSLIDSFHYLLESKFPENKAKISQGQIRNPCITVLLQSISASIKLSNMDRIGYSKAILVWGILSMNLWFCGIKNIMKFYSIKNRIKAIRKQQEVNLDTMSSNYFYTNKILYIKTILKGKIRLSKKAMLFVQHYRMVQFS